MSMWLSRFDLVAFSHYASRVLLVVAVLLLGWQLGSMLSFSLKQPVSLNSPAVGDGQPSSSSAHSFRVAPLYLLGRPALEQVDDNQKKSENVTETQLNLKVLGIVALPNDEGVVIVQSGSNTLLASVGEALLDDVYLEAVFSDHVVIDNNGAFEKLLMTEENEWVDVESFASESDTVLGSLKQTLKKSPMKIMQYVRFQLINAGKHDAKMKLWPKKEAELFKALGLEAGDVLTVINGQHISKLMKKPALWRKVLNEPVLEMEVEREGQVEFLVVELE
ncbi:MAG: hypothetical protein L3J00_08950 [Thiomicrorhabdus sp.]|nr:hypothetical protein [Thiomicrorhabdus sp.]